MVDGNGDRGFTLIEVLTAMMILTISMVTIFHLFSDGLNSAKLCTGYTRAIFHARAKMEEVLLADRLGEGESDGIIEEDYQWRLRIVPVEVDEEADLKDRTGSSVKLFQVSVDVTWKNGEKEKTFTLHTLHLAEISAEDENA